METYIGTKIIKAEPCSKKSEGDSPLPPTAGYKVVYEDGYTSWSPKEVFERCYRLVTDSEKKLI